VDDSVDAKERMADAIEPQGGSLLYTLSGQEGRGRRGSQEEP
jgi:hypothetical protein